MARTTINRLSDRGARTAKAGTTKAGTAKRRMHPDGGGLYLRVTAGTNGVVNRYWLFRYKQRGTRKDRQIGIGPLDTISLAQARATAREGREQLLAGLDPVDQRKAQRASNARADTKAMTFDACRDAYIAGHRASWGSVKHAKQWATSLATYAAPVLGILPVAAVDTGLVLKVLEPIWATKSETASRVRGRIEAILDWAKVRGYRTGENPARWRGHLAHMLPAKAKVHKVEHHPALPYEQMGGFMADLRKRPGTAARALEFAILTAARTDEVISARWDEIDMAGKLWVVPLERMKGKREHRVPLCDRALEILRMMMPDGQESIGRKYIFRGVKPGRPVSNRAMLDLIWRMNDTREVAGLPRYADPKQGGRDVVPHGFRSSFKDWATDWAPSPAEIVKAAKRGELVEAFPRDLIEVALAHRLDDKTEEAYRRTDMIDKRHRLMTAWAEFCSKPAGNGEVVSLRNRAPA